MKKVLVTGGRGFIGSAAVNRLIQKGYEPIVLDRHNKPGPGELMLGDIRDDVAVTEAAAHVDGIIHLAGVLGTAETIDNPRPAAYTNIIGGLNVLEAAAQYDLPVVNIAVGNYWMNNTYSITKNTVERFTSMFVKDRGLEATTVRALNAYGPGQSVAAPFGESKVRKIMPSFICRALTGAPVEIYGDGSQIMDMIYVTDVANILVESLEFTYEVGPASWVIEAGSGIPTTVNDIASKVIDVVGEMYGTESEIKHVPMRRGEPENSVVLADTGSLEALYGDRYVPVPLETGVRNAAEYFHNYLERNQMLP